LALYPELSTEVANIMRVELENYETVMKYLKAFENDTFKAVEKGLKEAVKPVAKRAADLYPRGEALSNWGRWIANGEGKNVDIAGGDTRDLSYRYGKIAKSIKPTTRKYRRIGMAQKNFIGLQVMDPAGSIFHTAGFGGGRYRYKGKRGLTFRENMRNKNPRPRPLWKAASEAGGEIEAAIWTELRKAESAFNRLQGN
jgi:hypothetical protein